MSERELLSSTERLARILADEALEVACEVFRLNPDEQEIYEFRKAVIERAKAVVLPSPSRQAILDWMET